MVIAGWQQQPDQRYDYVLALADLYADLADPGAWDVVDLDPSAAGDAFAGIAGDGSHLYLVGGATPAQQLVPAKWRYSLPPAALTDIPEGFFIPGFGSPPTEPFEAALGEALGAVVQTTCEQIPPVG